MLQEIYLIPENGDTKSGQLVKWVLDTNFNKEMQRLKVPEDPQNWTQQHVKLWLVWAVRQFNLSGLKLTDWMITGEDLCNMSPSSFKKIVPRDPGELFWTHIELIKQCKCVAVIEKEKQGEDKKTPKQPAVSLATPSTSNLGAIKKHRPKDGKKVSRILGSSNITVGEHKSGIGNRTGNNGQVQLWQFLLDLLTSKYHRDVIQWITDDGEFKLNNPEMVAQLWGLRKNKPAMTYEKLSRALRYYYDGDMIAKVHGKRFVYKFVCNLKQMLGYSPMELNRRVTESAVNSGIQSSYCDFYEHVME